MQITLQTAGLLALALIGSTHAYVIEIFESPDCQGRSQEWNVYDNTCSQPPFGFQSFKPVVYGGNVQVANFYSKAACAFDRTLATVLVDQGKDKRFQLSQCQNAFNGNGGTNAMDSLSDSGSYTLAGVKRAEYFNA